MAQSAASVILLEARAHRAQAERARGLASQLSEDPAIERLQEFARQLEARAKDLEWRADTLNQRLARTRDLAAEVEAELEQNREQARRLQQTLRDRGGADD